MEQHALIEMYLADEAKCYEDWYTALTQTESSQYAQKVRAIPPLDDLKKLCLNWIKQQQASITNQFCEKYAQIRKQFQNQETLLIAGVADSLSVVFTGVPINLLAVATILVSEKHLDQMCKC
ncbi:MAG TPA: hypothetical protein EYP59_10000 [Thiotrichaceae bacterium]|nr:hypothetical protein [Thiotrichaceae bacterium]